MKLFSSVPGVGPLLAARLHDELGLETLQQLEAAAYDGRLEEIAGFGPKRLMGIRDTLARRLGRQGTASETGGSEGNIPCVSELLDVDREYREKVEADGLPRITPRRFNPEHAAWLPILHTDRGRRHYTALFSNTARAHRLRQTRDWVVLYCDDGPQEHQWTVITAAFGPMQGRRIVAGREQECAFFYAAMDAAAVRGEMPSRPASAPEAAGHL